MEISKTFDYGTCRIKDFVVNATRTKDEDKRVRGGNRISVSNVEVAGRPCEASKRFWTSIQSRFGFSSNVFRYFDHKEVFDRISERSPNDMVRYCIEKDKTTGKDTLLAVTNPSSTTIKFDNLHNLFEQRGVDKISYDKGVVRSTHRPRIGSDAFDLAGDKFSNQFVIDTPIDGFGRLNVYLSLLRLICTNGAIGYDSAFRSEVNIGRTEEEAMFAVDRCMDGFNNEEGFAAIKSRFESAANSWASVNEAQRVYKLLTTMAGGGFLKKTGKEYIKDSSGVYRQVETALPIFDQFRKLTGDISMIYGLANIDSLSVKRQKTLPIACKMFDLLNFVTEVATHHSKEQGNRRAQALVGDLLASEFDLEGTCDSFGDWRDFFIGNDKTTDTLVHLSSRAA